MPKSIILGSLESSDSSGAHGLPHKLWTLSLCLDSQGYNAAIHTCAQRGDAAGAQRFLAGLRGARLEPDATSPWPKI